MTEEFIPYFTMSTNDIPEGTAISGVEVTLKPQKPRAAMVPGTTTVTLGSEEKNEPADVHD